MKTKKLLRAMEDIRPEYIEAVLKPGKGAAEDTAAAFVPEDLPAPQSRSNILRVITAAGLVACAVLAVGTGFWIYRTGRAARDNSALTNLEVTQTAEVEQAVSLTEKTTETTENALGYSSETETEAETSVQSDYSEDLTHPFGFEYIPQEQTEVPRQTEPTETLLSKRTESINGSDSAQTTESSQTTSVIGDPKKDPETDSGMKCVVFKNYGFDTTGFRSEWWQTGQPISFLLHSLRNIEERNMSGDLLDAAFTAFLRSDETKDWRTDEFYEKNDVITGALYLESGSYELGVQSLAMVSSGATGRTTLRLNLLAYKPEVMDCAMCCYYYAISVPKGTAEGYTRVETSLQYISPSYDPVTGNVTDDRHQFWENSCWSKPAIRFVYED